MPPTLSTSFAIFVNFDDVDNTPVLSTYFPQTDFPTPSTAHFSKDFICLLPNQVILLFSHTIMYLFIYLIQKVFISVLPPPPVPPAVFLQHTTQSLLSFLCERVRQGHEEVKKKNRSKKKDDLIIIYIDIRYIRMHTCTWYMFDYHTYIFISSSYFFLSFLRLLDFSTNTQIWIEWMHRVKKYLAQSSGLWRRTIGDMIILSSSFKLIFLQEQHSSLLL